MIKTLWAVLCVVLWINLLAAAGFVAWLYKSGRLNQDRVDRIRQMLTLTVAEEEEQRQQAAAQEEEARQKAMEAARLESVSDGPDTLDDFLKAERLGDEMAMQRIERLQRDIRDLQRQLAIAKQLYTKQSEQFAAERKAFEEAASAQSRLQRDQNFQQAVRMYEQVKPRQAKEMFQELIRRDQTAQVVDYLAAMQMRKAASVLKEFKTPAEVAQATELIQRLRQRGVNLAGLEPSDTGDAKKTS